jgi:regulator of cell morphogenesis and NO signaling
MILKINEQYEAIPLEMGQTQRDLQNIYKMFSVIYKDLKQHMLKEEQILFPYIKQLIALREAGSKSETPYFGKIDNPICMMENEHKSALDKFDELKRKTNNFIAPDISNQASKKFFNELKNFGKDLHIHIHLENNLLFPKAIALEKKML